MKKIVASLIAVVTTFLFCASVFAFTKTFSFRGNTYQDTAKYYMMGKICRLSENDLYVRVDANTGAHTIVFKMQYWTPGALGIYGISDEEILLNEPKGNGTIYQVSYQIHFSERSLCDPTYNTTDKAFVRAVASGGTNAYYYEIGNAVFGFYNN